MGSEQMDEVPPQRRKVWGTRQNSACREFIHHLLCRDIWDQGSQLPAVLSAESNLDFEGR